MRLITKVALSIKGDRIERGTEVELSEEDFKQYDINDFTPVGAVAEEPEPEPEPSIEDMSLEELKAKAKELDLTVSGSKADLVERITLHLQSLPEVETEEHN